MLIVGRNSVAGMTIEIPQGMDMTDAQLRTNYLFTHLSAHQLTQLKQGMQTITLPNGAFLFRQGQAAHHFFWLLEGHIKLTRFSLEGTEKVIEVVRAGENFAEALMFMDNPAYPVNAQAIEASKIIAFDNRLFIAILRDSFETCLRLLCAMSQRIHFWLQEIDHLTLQNATYRLINYLLSQIPLTQQGEYTIDLAVPKNVIASRLSITPETLSRILHSLTKTGLLTVDKQTICISNVHQFRLYSQSDKIRTLC